MFIKHFRYQDTKHANFITYRGLRNLIFICGYGNSDLLEKPYRKIYFLYLLGLIGCFAWNAVYAVNHYSFSDKSYPALTLSVLCTALQYIIYLFIRICFSVYNIAIEVHAANAMAGFKQSPKDHTGCLVLITIITTYIFTGEVQWLIHYFHNYDRDSFYAFFSHILFFICDIGQVTNVLPIDVVRARAKFARQILEKKLMENVRQSVKIEKIKEVMKLYKNWTSFLKTTKNMTNLQILVCLLQAFTYTIRIITNRDISIFKMIIQLSYVLFLPCASSIVYELYVSELDKIKRMIVKEYAFCSDEKNRRLLSDVLLVWRVRNYNHRTMWRLFRLDISLVFNFISLVTTYSVVVAQFQKVM